MCNVKTNESFDDMGHFLSCTSSFMWALVRDIHARFSPLIDSTKPSRALNLPTYKSSHRCWRTTGNEDFLGSVEDTAPLDQGHRISCMEELLHGQASWRLRSTRDRNCP